MSGRKKQQRQMEKSDPSYGTDKFEGVERYWTSANKKDDKFALSYLDKQVFSWSIKDVLNKDLFREKVKKIPETFASSNSYFCSFAYPLIEETRADLFSSLDGYAHQSFIQVIRMKRLHGRDKIFFCFEVASPAKDGRSREAYAPSEDDMIVLSSVKPKQVSDLTRNKKSYILAKIVKGGEEDDDLPDNCFIARLSSAFVEADDPETEVPKEPLFAVLLVNMKTHNRIWACLEMGKSKAARIVDLVWQYKSKMAVTEFSTEAQLSQSFPDRSIDDLGLEKFMLNSSQLSAVSDCVLATGKIFPSIKLIWGPPGTGKTKTISTLLWAMLLSSHRTLTCAPTNTAVLEVASRIVKIVCESSTCSSVFLSDIILFGNKKRMHIDENHDLSAVFLSSRTKRLSQCFSKKPWNLFLSSLIDFLENVEKQHLLYTEKISEKMKERERENNEKSRSEDGMISLCIEDKDLDNDMDAVKIEYNIEKDDFHIEEEPADEDCHQNEGLLSGNVMDWCDFDSESTEQMLAIQPLKEYAKFAYNKLATGLLSCMEVLHADFPRNPTMGESFHCMTEVAELLKIIHAFINADDDDSIWFDGLLEEQKYQECEPLKWPDLLAVGV